MDLLDAFGAPATGERARRMQRSPQFRDGRFHNTVPGQNAVGFSDVYREWRRAGDSRKPANAIPLVTDAPTPASTGVQLTWLGHATALVELEGRRLLIDPVWSDRCSPASFVGPKRLHPMPYGLKELGHLDAIVFSHDHYDHLDMPTVRALLTLTDAPFVAPLGIGAHLQRWGVPAARNIELDWDESVEVKGVTLVATAARHFSGRGLTRDRTLWASWVLAGPTRKIFYSGDTGYFDGFARIGAAHGPFDASLIQVGAYGEGWPDIHMTPEDGVRAHMDVQGGLMVPVHWGSFVLAFHPWAEPIERVLVEAKERDVRVAVPRPGQRIDVDNPPEVDGWWRAAA